MSTNSKNKVTWRSRIAAVWTTVALAAATLTMAVGTTAGQETTPVAPTVDHADLDVILRDVVRGERVDYERVQRIHARSLKAYLDRLATVDFAPLPRKEGLAYAINLYNATMIQAVLDRRRESPGWTPAADSFAVFDAKLVRMRKQTVSLNHLEHEIIRPKFKDPRIHVALVCGAVSCPPLLPRAYVSRDLDAVLDANMRRFVNDRARNTIDRSNRRIVLSRLFDWYADDFGGKSGVVTYVNQWTDGDVASFDVSFREYDWSLNVTLR